MLCFIFCYDLNGQIRTPEFALFTGNAVFGPNRHGLIFIIKFQYFLWTKMNTNAASFAPVPVYVMFFEFRFWHVSPNKKNGWVVLFSFIEMSRQAKYTMAQYYLKDKRWLVPHLIEENEDD